MRAHLPSSRGYFRLRFSIFDTCWAALSPVLALYLRGAYILHHEESLWLAASYCVISFLISMIVIVAFRLNDGITRYFSVHDVVNILKAVTLAALVSAIFLFTVTRLQGIPRSTPLAHAFILAAGLIAVRAFALLRDGTHSPARSRRKATSENIILVGANDLAAFYIKFSRAYSPGRYRIIGVLDDEHTLFGRTVIGVPVVGAVKNIDRVIEEFAVHGVRTDGILVAGDDTLVSRDALAEARSVCEQRKLQLQFIPDLINFGKVRSNNTVGAAEMPNYRPPVISLPAFHKTKRVIDFFISATAIFILLPLFAMVSLLILFDVGTPLIFWQQRIGQDGNDFFLYKFRTLHAPFNWLGQPISEARRLSWVGRALRATRFDELPQLFNVLVGDMSLIGPRPLLPVDQPKNSTLRLAARPGITGWAQINGGNLVTNEEKGALDDWYVRNASLWLDLRIVGLTLLFLFRGERRSEAVLQTAIREQFAPQAAHGMPAPSRRTVREALGGTLRRARPIKIRTDDREQQQFGLRANRLDVPAEDL